MPDVLKMVNDLIFLKNRSRTRISRSSNNVLAVRRVNCVQATSAVATINHQSTLFVSKAIRVFPILYWNSSISRNMWIQLESVKHHWRLLKAFLCLPLTFGSFEFTGKYTKLTMLSFLYCFVVRGKLISAKSLPPVGIEPATLRP